MATGAAWLNRKKIMARTANPKVCLDIDRPSHRRTCAHSKKVRGKSPRRYNSCVRQPMRHVMALRVSKAVLVFAIALFYTILVLNNITDYGSNYEFCPPRPDDGLNPSGEPPHVARRQFAASRYGLLH